MKIFLAIDPGAVSGAWGAIDSDGEYFGCGDIPHVDGKIDVIKMQGDVSECTRGHEYSITIELVGSMPKQGLSSTYKFGRAVGAIEAVCELTGKKVTYVRPAKWKKEMTLTADKYASLDMARELFPRAPLARVKDHNKAEALLLAAWARTITLV